MESESAKAKLAAVKERFGREMRVFETSVPTQSPKEPSADDESEDFYEFTPEDYFRILSTKKEDKFLKTRKLREADKAARRSKITKAVIRVRFPDNHTLEVNFHSSETVQSLVDILKKVITKPEIPFYLYTTPPKKQIKDMTLDFHSAGFIPGAIVYFAYDLPKDDDANSGPFLQNEIMSLKGTEITEEQAPEPDQSATKASGTDSMHSPALQQPKSAGKQPAKPKWFKM
jgi:tether containing UBX domain for GLUT4